MEKLKKYIDDVYKYGSCKFEKYNFSLSDFRAVEDLYETMKKRNDATFSSENIKKLFDNCGITVKKVIIGWRVVYEN